MTTLETLRKKEILPMPDWGAAYLNALDQNEGFHGKSVEVLGLSWNQVYYARTKCDEFSKAVEEVRDRWRSNHLDKLENISMTQAMKPGCVTERLFRMKQLDPTYRDKQGGTGPGGIRIILGFDMDAGGRKRTSRKKITASAEVGPKIKDGE